jgi:hypothetical protein
VESGESRQVAAATCVRLIRPVYERCASITRTARVVLAQNFCLGARLMQEKHGVATATVHIAPYRSHGDADPETDFDHELDAAILPKLNGRARRLAAAAGPVAPCDTGGSRRSG